MGDDSCLLETVSIHMDRSITIIGICNKEPWYKKRSQCNRKEVTLTVSTPEDSKIAKLNGVAALRRHRLKRICRECEEQDALLSYEQLANLLTASIKTISRDIKHIENTEDLILRTRGNGVIQNESQNNQKEEASGWN